MLVKILFESEPNFSNQMTPEAATKLLMLSKTDKMLRKTFKLMIWSKLNSSF